MDLPSHFNVAAHFLNLNPQAGRGGKTHLICGEERLSYDDLLARTRRLAHALGELGLQPEQRVMLLLPDTTDFPPCFWAPIWLGAVSVPVNTMLKGADFRYMLEDSRARILIVDRQFWGEVEPILEGLPYLRHVIMTGEPAPGTTPLADLLGGQEAGEAEPMSPDDSAFWMYTSGSTGAPKAAVHLHRDMLAATENYARGVLGLREDDVTFSAAKYFFAYGLGNSLYFPIAAGCTALVYPGRPTPEAMFEQIAKHRPTVFYGVPTLYNAMLNTYEAWQAGQDAPAELPRLDSLRFGVSAGEALPAETFERWQRHFGCELLDGIGSTEMLHIFISNRLGDTRPGSSGKPVPGYETQLVDENGDPVPLGEAGTLLVKGDSAAAYYWNKHEKTKATMLGEWVVTGDQYVQDEDGFFWYQGRNDDMMKVSGSWVSPVEVEAALLTHDAVAESAVVAHTDDAGLVKPKAFVVLKGGQSGDAALAEALKAHVKQHVAGFKTPQWIEFVEDLPKTATGKIRRFALRD